MVSIPVLVVLSTISVWRLGTWLKEKKVFFDKLGKDLDSNFVSFREIDNADQDLAYAEIEES